MKGKLVSSIAGLTLALGLSVANAGPASGVQSLANGATNAQAAQSSAGMEAFSAVLGSAHYVPMSDRELSRVNGKQLGGVVTVVEGVLADPVGSATALLTDPVGTTVGAVGTIVGGL